MGIFDFLKREKIINTEINILSSDFKKNDLLNVEILKSENIIIEFKESDLHSSILIAKFRGKIPDGSLGTKDSNYIRQQIGLCLINSYFCSVLLDLTDLTYNWGDSIVSAFEIINQISYSDTKIDNAFVLSDKNKYGFSSLFCFDIENPKDFIFYDFNLALEYLINRTEK